MRQILSFSMFITTFFLVCFAANYYIFWRISGLLSIKRNVIYYVILVLFSLSFLLASTLEHYFANSLTRGIYTVTAYWQGIGLILLSCLVVYEVVNIFITVPKTAAGYAILIVAAVASLYSMINARVLRTTVVDMPAPVNMKIVQLSDIHLGSTGEKFLKKVVEQTNSLKPDLILITGDVFDPGESLEPQIASVFNGLNAPAFFVTGNHETYVGVAKVMDFLANTKVKPLRNKAQDFNGIQIIGLDDSHNGNNVENTLKKIPLERGKYSILMNHRPLGFEIAAKYGVNLMLSGHTHNGQIFPFNFVVKMFFHNIRGLYEKDNSFLYVSTGTGTWGPRMRLGSNNEIVLINLQKHSTSSASN